MVREAVRVLQSLGLVDTTKRVGIRVLPPEPLEPVRPPGDPLAAGRRRPRRAARSLAELRSAVEPVAAELAAANAPPELRRELLDVSLAMRDAGQAGDVAIPGAGHPLPFPAAERLRQRNVREPVGQVAETLTGRTVHGLMPDHPREVALQWHVDVAEAIFAGDAAGAREASSRIMRETITEMEAGWRDQPRVFVPLPRA